MIRRWLKDVRNNYFISKVFIFVGKPVHQTFVFLANQIQMKVKKNGGELIYDGIKIDIPKNVGVGMASNIFWNGTAGFEPWTWQTIKQCTLRADIFLDIGSNFGLYSVLVQKINLQIKTYCFEPIHELYADNIRFHALNEMNRQETFQKAISNSIGKIEMQIPQIGNTHDVRSASIEKDFFFNRKFTTKTQETETVTLDNMLLDNLEWIGKRMVVKIDVEGHEWAALKGGVSFLSKLKPIVICEIDYSSSHFKEVVEILQSVKYYMYAIVKEGLFHIDLDDVGSYKGGNDFLLTPNLIAKSYISFDGLAQNPLLFSAKP